MPSSLRCAGTPTSLFPGHLASGRPNPSVPRHTPSNLYWSALMAKVVTEMPHEKQPRRSTESPSAWELGGLTWPQLLNRLWTNMDSNHDDTFGRAAELAYFFFLAVFPGLFFIMTVLGLLAGTHEGFRTTLFS